MIEFCSLPVGETLLGRVDLERVVIRGDEPGPTVCLVSGVHGNETSSVLGLLMFIRWLRNKMKDNGGGKPKFPFKGKVVAFTGVNQLGLMLNERGIRDHVYGMEDSNRGFPGDPKGSLRDRIANRLFSEIVRAHADVVVDLHTGNSRSLPIVVVDRTEATGVEKRSVDYAYKFGFACCYDLLGADYVGKGLSTSLAAELVNSGIPAFTVEVPGGPFAQDEAAREVLAGIMRLVSGFEMTPEVNPSVHLYRNLHLGKMYQRASGPRANKAGIFWPLASPGNAVTTGQHVATIMDRRGEDIEYIQAHADGVISDVVDASVVATGDQLFELLVDDIPLFRAIE